MKFLNIVALAVSLISAAAVTAKPVTNETVSKLLSAEVGEELILKVIAAGEPQFDTSPEAIAALKSGGATPAVLTAIITGGSITTEKPAASAPTTPSAAAPAGTDLAADVVLLVDGSTERTLSYTAAESRIAARGLGFGGAAVYAVLPGSASDVSVSSSAEFIASVPSNAKPQSQIQLASFAIRRNGTREVMVGGGVMSMTIGIHPDRVIALDFEQLADQGRASAGHTLYRVKPKAPLAGGQYALVGKLSGSAGLGGANISGQWYDFQVN